MSGIEPTHVTTLIAILMLAGCAAQSPVDRELAETRRQLEFACMRDLLNQGHQLMYEAEPMTAYCRQVSRRVTGWRRTTR